MPVHGKLGGKARARKKKGYFTAVASVAETVVRRWLALQSWELFSS